MVLTPVFEEVENGWVQATIRELPEIITVAPDQDQAFENLKDALHEYVESYLEDGLPVPFDAQSVEDAELAAA